LRKLNYKATKGTKSEKDLAHDFSRFIDVADVELHYEFQDSKEETLIVLLHGFGANTYSFRKLLPELSKFGKVISYDRPAFGLTVRPKSWSGENPYAYDYQIRLLDELINSFSRTAKVILVGHSAGAAVATDWALLNQDRVKALILEAPAFRTFRSGPKPASKLLQSSLMNSVGPRLVAGFKKAGTKILYRSWFDDSGITQEVFDAYYLPLEIKGWEAAFWEFMRNGVQSTINQHLHEIKIPTLVITGDHDQVIPTRDSIGVSKNIEDAELKIVASCGHIPHEEKPKEFMESLTAFLSQQ
jgi:pimeloyl-ACP methyl ester carboxylesterase